MNLEVANNLKNKAPMFFPDTGKEFRDAFRRRWYSDCLRKFALRLRLAGGTHNGQEGSFVWTEKL